MTHRKRLGPLVALIATSAAALPLAAGCGEDNPLDDLGGDAGLPGVGECEASLTARFEALSASVDAMSELATTLKADVATACAEIAGDTAPDNPSDQEVSDACDAAVTRIEAEFSAQAAGDVTVVVTPAQCSVNAEAQFECEADCQAEANLDCEAPMIEARCEAGELSVQCEGMCEAGATCQGSAEVAVDCEGSCTGKCDGDCEGTCSVENNNGSCAGECEGTCTGSCEGECEITAAGGVECSGGASCKGGCDGEFTAPKCEGELTPAMCEGNAEVDCSGDCSGAAKMEAECTPPSIEITATGELDADFEAALMANLPVLLRIAAKGELIGEAAGDLAAEFKTSGEALVEGGVACAAAVGANFVAQADAALEASVSVEVSVMASASASGSATAGG